jgi:hypothetical protein
VSFLKIEVHESLESNTLTCRQDARVSRFLSTGSPQTLCLPRYAYHAMLTMLSVISKMRRVLEMTLIRTINLQSIQLASDGDVCMAAALSTLSVFDYLFLACLMLGKTAGFITNSLVGLCT